MNTIKNKILNTEEILYSKKVGDRVYSKVHGRYGNITALARDGILVHFTTWDGKHEYNCKFEKDGSLIVGGECMLFPNKSTYGWNKLTLNQLKSDINLTALTQRNENIRMGQFIFNYIDDMYNVAREVQFEDNVDCFHLDEKIDEFLLCSLKRINNYIG